MYKYNNIENMRKDNNIGQKELAALLNITQQQYSRYERGIYEIPLHLAIQLADYYMVSLDYLIRNKKTSDK